jgi:tetratricopeptide (TPR) repeat protein
MNDPRRAALALVLWMAPIVACLSGATVAQAAQADDEAAIRLLAQDWISTQELEKLDAFLALWAPDAPGAERRRDFTPVVFQSGNDRFTDVRIDRVTIDAGRGTVRVVADRERTLPGGNTIPSQVAVVFECVRTPDGWRLLAESSAYAAFADELIGLTDQAAIDARLDADRRLLGRELLRALGERGDRGSFTGSLDRAMVAYRLVRSIALRLGDADAAIAALQNIGNVHFFRQNYADALESYKERLAEETARGDKAGMATALQAIASAHYAFADYVAALDAYRRALDILEPLDDRPALASLYMNVGNVYLLQGDYAAAVESFGRSRILFEAMPDHTGPAAKDARRRRGATSRRRSPLWKARSRSSADRAIAAACPKRSAASRTSTISVAIMLARSRSTWTAWIWKRSPAIRSASHGRSSRSGSSNSCAAVLKRRSKPTRAAAISSARCVEETPERGVRSRRSASGSRRQPSARSTTRSPRMGKRPPRSRRSAGASRSAAPR